MRYLKMQRLMLLSKIHRATVTERDLNYVGSVTIDKNLIEACGIYVNEKVDIYNISNGNRFSTYVIEGEAGSGIIGVNGAAARMVSLGDKVIICNYGRMTEEEIAEYEPTVIVVEDDENLEFHKHV
jgi:aspartate 1-decarboxylase